MRASRPDKVMTKLCRGWPSSWHLDGFCGIATTVHGAARYRNLLIAKPDAVGSIRCRLHTAVAHPCPDPCHSPGRRKQCLPMPALVRVQSSATTSPDVTAQQMSLFTFPATIERCTLCKHHLDHLSCPVCPVLPPLQPPCCPHLVRQRDPDLPPAARPSSTCTYSFQPGGCFAAPISARIGSRSRTADSQRLCPGTKSSCSRWRDRPLHPSAPHRRFPTSKFPPAS